MEACLGLTLAHDDYPDYHNSANIHNCFHNIIGGDMPYKRKGSVIYHKKNSRWEVKQRCKNVKSAKAALRLLEDLERQEK